MKIDKILQLGISALAFMIVLVTASLLIRDMLWMAEENLTGLDSVSESVKAQNVEMFASLNKTAAGVNDNIYEITGKAAEEQLRNVGNGIAEEIKAVMNMPFASVKTLATTIMFEKTRAEESGETPDRDWVENYLIDFLMKNDDAQALFTSWEKNAFDGKDEEFIGKEQENADEDMDIGNPEYESEGAFLPWLYKGENKDGSLRIIRGFTDDYLISDTNYYTGPRDSKKDFITEPYLDGGISITSFCVPVMRDDNVLGVVGIDVSLETLEDIVKNRKPFETGFAMFFSPGGSIVYYPDKEINFKEDPESEDLVYRHISEIEALKTTARHLEENKSVIYTTRTLPGRSGIEMMVIHVPVQFGDYPAKWTVAVAAPVDKVMADRNNAKKGMDEMVFGIETQNDEFVKKLDNQVTLAVDASEKLKSYSFWKSVLVGFVVLAVSIATGSFFAVCVNRSISARDFRYRQILDASSDPISVVDMNMRIVFLNKPALTILRTTIDECIGRTIEDVWRHVIGNDYVSCGLRVLKSGRKDSQAKFHGVYWDVTSDYILDSRNNRDGMVEIYKDVSDRENVFKLVGSVDDVIKSTAEQTSSMGQAASDLSQGAEQQADSLASITADMKLTNEQTQKNADNAQEANRLSADAGESAALGQKRMQEMVASMNQISSNAKNMQAVIQTIDDIAFQTNLLALNAAVEAARAGTHGKGFAVVAEEVRNLAARSAKAAKETEALILESNVRIEGGVAVADQTAEALNAISGRVTEVSTLIEQIASASKEQTVGVERMTATLHTVDQITQQNVDLASTTANATQLLSNEVNELQNLMSRLQKTDDAKKNPK